MINKKKHRRGLSALLSVLLLISLLSTVLAGCGGEPDPNCGTWAATTVAMDELEFDAEEVYPGGLLLKLEDGGKAYMTIDGTDNRIKWYYGEDDLLYIEDATTATGGYIEDGILIMEDFGGAGITICFERTE